MKKSAMLWMAGLISLASSAFDSGSYVQNGLAVQFDGIDNQGRGVQDTSATSWVDVKRPSVRLTFKHEAWVEEGYEWTAAGLKFSAPSNSCEGDYTSRYTFSSPAKTFESFVIAGPSAKFAWGFWNQWYGGVRPGFYCSSTDILYLFEGPNSTGTQNGSGFQNVTPSLPGPHYMCAAVNDAGTQATLMYDGTSFSKTSSYIAWTAIGRNFWVNKWANGPMYFGTDTTYCAFRVYNRCLTADEIAVNRAIDRIRFESASPSSVDLPPRYKIEGGEVQFEIVAKSDVGGQVKLDGGDAAELCGKWFSFSSGTNGQASVSLTAVPSPGATFDRWTGDVDAISSGSATDASITVATNRAALLTATFTYEPVTAEWTGGGETTSVADGRNWAGGNAPDLVSGITSVRVTGGSGMTLAQSSRINKLTVELPSRAVPFVIDGASGTTLRIGEGGIEDDAAIGIERTVSVRIPLVLKETCQFVMNGTETNVWEFAGISIEEYVSVAKTGKALVRFVGDSEINGELTFGKEYTYRAGAVDVLGCEISGKGTFKLEQVGLWMSNATISVANPQIIQTIGNGRYEILNAFPHSTNTFHVALTMKDKAVRATFAAYSKTIFDGLDIGNNWISATIPPYGAIVFNKPLVTTGHTGFSEVSGRAYAAPVEISYNASGNYVDTIGYYYNTHAYWNAERAFDSSSIKLSLRQYSANAQPVVDLCGHTHRIGQMVPVQYNGGKIHSDAPGTLEIGNSSDSDVGYAFTGAAGLRKLGTCTLTISNVVNTTTGVLEVAEGSLRFWNDSSSACSWTNGTKVVVSGGTLYLDTAQRLNPKADYYVSGGRIDIPGGVVIRGGDLYVPDGTGGWKKRGGAVFTRGNCDFVSGDGALILGKPGFVIDVR